MSMGMGMVDEFENLEAGSGGGTRMSQLRAQARQLQRRQQQMGSMMGGFEQKFAVPLDDDDEEDVED